MKIEKRNFGTLSAGEAVHVYIMKNGAGMEVHLLDFGAIVHRVFAPDQEGRLRDVVLGHPSIEGYEGGRGFFGGFIGRYANRIKGAAFELDGKRYEVLKNNGENFLHGTFHKKLYEVELLEDGICFFRVSPDGEDGFPGNLSTRATFRLTEDNRLLVDYCAETDAPTVVNFTCHSYFNLDGQDSGPVLQQNLAIAAESFLPPGEDPCPTGELALVEGTPMDFRESHAIGDRITDPYVVASGNGYDHCYVLDKTVPWAAKAYSERSGIGLTIQTTQVGMQLYTGNFIGGITGKDGAAYEKHSGFALEPQAFPCSPNYPHFPSTVLRPGEVYSQSICYSFDVMSEEKMNNAL